MYKGYISEQIAGKQVLIYAEYASLVFKQKDIKNQRDDYFDFNRLTDGVKGEVRRMCDTTSLKLTSFEYNGTYYENMYVCERLDSTLRAYALTPRTYPVVWKDLLKTEKIEVSDKPYGIREIVTLKSGERLVGQIIAQEISKSLTIRTENNLDRTVPASDVLSIMSEPVSEKHTIWQQLPLLDRVVDENGVQIEGFITSRLLGQNINVQARYSNLAQQIKMKNVVKLQKTLNPDFEPFVPDTTKVITINNRKAELVHLALKNESYTTADTLFQKFFVNTDLNLSMKNIEHGKTVSLYKYDSLKKSKFKIPSNDSLTVSKTAAPIYETTYKENDIWQTCDVIVRKPGKYFLAIDGFKSGINLEILEEIEEKDKKK